MTVRCAICLMLAATLARPAQAQHDIDLIQPGSVELERDYDGFILAHAPADSAFVAVQRVAEPYLREHNWQKAIAAFERYRALFPARATDFDAITEILARPDEGLLVRNLGEGINTSAAEYNPVPTADGRTMYFVGEDRPDGLGGEDIYASTLQDSAWGPAVNLGSAVNTKSHEFVTAVSADGTRLIFLGNYPESLGRGDLFYADRTAEGWGAVRHFPPPINSPSFDCDGFLTSDGKAMLFVSDRPGVIGAVHPKEKKQVYHGEYWGNTDIFVSLKTDTGWSTPVNLGPVINTPFAERTPFLHPDGKTLYFSSSGHGGLGRLDVYKSERLDSTSWTAWSTPVNLGKEINTPGDDWGYRIATAGDVAYFTATGRMDGYGQEDIYSVTLPRRVRPRAVATIRGHVTDSAGRPLDADIRWEDLESRAEVGALKSDPRTGAYFLAVPLGHNYGYYASKPGYYPVSKSLDLRGQTSALAVTENIVLVSIAQMKKEETSVRINNIFFEYDRADLRPESYPELNRVAEILKENADARVEIGGYTDSMGTDAYNLDLSRRRAQAVVSYLVAAGCTADLLVARGYGRSHPVASNATDEGRARNRRVEFKFLR